MGELKKYTYQIKKETQMNMYGWAKDSNPEPVHH